MTNLTPVRRLAAATALVLSLAFAASAHGWNVTYANGPDPAVAAWPSWPYPVGCLGTTFDPVSTFSGPTEAELGQGGAERALRQYLDEDLYPQLPARFWRPIVSTDARAVFASGRLEQGLFWLAFEFVDGRWRPAGNLDECSPRTVRDGNVAIDWGMPGGQRLTPDSRRIEVNLHSKGPCDGGRSHNEAAEPEFRKVGRRLLVTIWLKPPAPLPPGGHYNCKKRREGPLVLRLPGRLGKLQLWDGGTYPPHRER